MMILAAIETAPAAMVLMMKRMLLSFVGDNIFILSTGGTRIGSRLTEIQPAKSIAHMATIKEVAPSAIKPDIKRILLGLTGVAWCEFNRS